MDDLREYGVVLHLAAAQKWLPKLVSALRAERKKRSVTLAQIGDTFGDPFRLAKCYVQPLCQQNNPATEDRDIDAVVCSDAFATLETFFERCKADLVSDGRRQMFILADAGMGKTSLLIMLRLAHLFSFWPSTRKCVLLKLDTNTAEEISKLEDHAHTILLLDSLDEDPSAIGRIRNRISEILAQTNRFYAVVITCRTQYFPVADPVTDPDPLERLGSVRVAGYRCPIVYLSPFTDRQVNEYLYKRFPRNLWRWLGGLDSPRYIAAQRVLEKTLTLHFRPMLLAYIDDLVGMDIDRELSAFEAFDILVREWLEREVRRGKVESKEALYAACLAVAKRLDKLEQRAVSRDQLTEIYLEDPKVQNIELIDVGGRALLNMTSAGAFRFAHFALQEFVLAKEIVHWSSTHALLKIADDIEPFSVRGTTELIAFIYEGLISKTGPDTLLLEQAFRRIPSYREALNETHDILSRLLPVPRSALFNVEFRDAQFSSARLSDIGFVACRFRGGSFARSLLDRSTFVDCDMQNANLANAILTGAVLINVDLRRADLSGANLCGANLRTSLLQSAADNRVILNGAVYDEQTEWPADFDYEAAGAVVRQVQLSEIFKSRTHAERVTGDTEIATDRGAVRRLVW